MDQFYLVTDATAAQVEHSTGLKAIDTPLGALVKAIPSVNLEILARLDDLILHPKQCNCSGVIHQPNCPFAYAIT